MLKLLSFEEFKEMKRKSYIGFKETANGYSHEIYGGGRIYHCWQEEYEIYCDLEQAYIKRITPLYNFLKMNKDKTYSIKELQQELNDNTIKSGTMFSLVKKNIVKQIKTNTTIIKYQINQTEED